jgi:hypothetical protein
MVIYLFPLSKAQGAPPTFNNKDVTSFLKKYELIYDIYQIRAFIRLKRVSEYYKDNIIREIEAFTI